jgi:hypothetical protein
VTELRYCSLCPYVAVSYLRVTADRRSFCTGYTMVICATPVCSGSPGAHPSSMVIYYHLLFEGCYFNVRGSSVELDCLKWSRMSDYCQPVERIRAIGSDIFNQRRSMVFTNSPHTSSMQAMHYSRGHIDLIITICWILNMVRQDYVIPFTSCITPT